MQCVDRVLLRRTKAGGGEHEFDVVRTYGAPSAAVPEQVEAVAQIHHSRADEPPQVCRRLQNLRDWSYDESEDVPEVLGRGA